MNEKFEPVGLIEISRQLLGKGRKLDPAKIEEAMKRNETVWKAGYDVGYTEGFKAGSITSTEPTSEQRDRDLLESHGIDIEPLFENVQKIIADHETGSTTSHMIQQREIDAENQGLRPDIDEDEPDQYQPEPEKWGGTK